MLRGLSTTGKVLSDQDFCRAPVREMGSPEVVETKKHTTEFVEKELAGQTNYLYRRAKGRSRSKVTTNILPERWERCLLNQHSGELGIVER